MQSRLNKIQKTTHACSEGGAAVVHGVDGLSLWDGSVGEDGDELTVGDCGAGEEVGEADHACARYRQLQQYFTVVGADAGGDGVAFTLPVFKWPCIEAGSLDEAECAVGGKVFGVGNGAVVFEVVGAGEYANLAVAEQAGVEGGVG